MFFFLMLYWFFPIFTKHSFLLNRFFEHLKETENINLIEGHLHSIANGLVSFGAHITENTLALTLETLNILLSVSDY